MINVIALIGPAGSGKDTILKTALEKIPQLHRVVSYTTRPKREGEIEGREYKFISLEDFEQKLLNQELIEANVFNGWGYGTSLDCFNKDKTNIMITTPSGLELLLQSNELRVFPCFVRVTDKTRLIRQLKREEHPDIDEIMRRYKTDKEDFYCLSFSYRSLPNEDRTDLKESIKDLRALVKSI